MFFAKRLKYQPAHSTEVFSGELLSPNNKESKYQEINKPAEENQIRAGSNFIDVFRAIRKTGWQSLTAPVREK